MPKIRQRHCWGSDAWIAAYVRRSRVEGAFGNIKSAKTENVRCGWTHVVGLVKTGLMVVIAQAAANLRCLCGPGRRAPGTALTRSPTSTPRTTAWRRSTRQPPFRRAPGHRQPPERSHPRIAPARPRAGSSRWRRACGSALGVALISSCAAVSGRSSRQSAPSPSRSPAEGPAGAPGRENRHFLGPGFVRTPIRQ